MKKGEIMNSLRDLMTMAKTLIKVRKEKIESENNPDYEKVNCYDIGYLDALLVMHELIKNEYNKCKKGF